MGVGGKYHALDALPVGKGRGTYFTGVWVGPKPGLDGCRRFCPHWDSIPGPSSL
jgi:hypothetical protein